MKITFHEFRERIAPYTKKIVIALALSAGIFTLWAATLSIPNVENFEDYRLSSTKIYDRTGEILLYDFNENVRQTSVEFADISQYVKEASIAVEDDEFYNHHGVRPLSFLRALWVNVKEGGFSQGGSTITQQVVKNSLLSRDKLVSRKIKEWILALKIERRMSKDEILRAYLNSNPYGGTLYGVQEASTNFFGKSAKDVTLAEAAYLAALPQAPTYYSPYGNNRDKLENRKNFVLDRMYQEGYITEEERDKAKEEKVDFLAVRGEGIKAPHFVFMIREYLEEKYGTEVVEKGGLRVVTTLDYELQEKGEAIVRRNALENAQAFNAENAALVAIDPKTGEILTMVGSRDYFDENIDGQFNAARAFRQPGSAFKPFIYATAFKKGYTPDTVVFDLPTQFSTACAPDNFTSEGGCYAPQNYDNLFRGPVRLKDALAQSLNIPAVKAFYLAGLNDSLKTAQDMGITSLADIGRYGLSLVLGGGEVSLLEMTNAYGVFATDGELNRYTGVLSVTDMTGKKLEEFKPETKRVLDTNVARQINSILSNNSLRAPAFGPNSYLYIPGRDVAAKTGTTNDYRDAWIVGYTPNVVVGAWAGNNDSSSMEKKVAGMIVAPLWNEFIRTAIAKIPSSSFTEPTLDYSGLKPVLTGTWMDQPSNPHDILHWVSKEDPRGVSPSNPSSDSQYSLWEYSVRRWNAPAPEPTLPDYSGLTEDELRDILDELKDQLGDNENNNGNRNENGNGNNNGNDNQDDPSENNTDPDQSE